MEWVKLGGGGVLFVESEEEFQSGGWILKCMYVRGVKSECLEK